MFQARLARGYRKVSLPAKSIKTHTKTIRPQLPPSAGQFSEVDMIHTLTPDTFPSSPTEVPAFIWQLDKAPACSVACYPRDSMKSTSKYTFQIVTAPTTTEGFRASKAHLSSPFSNHQTQIQSIFGYELPYQGLVFYNRFFCLGSTLRSSCLRCHEKSERWQHKEWQL